VQNTYSQSVTDPIGGEQWMLAGNSAAIANVFGVANNAAAITQINKFQAGLYSQQRFSESHLQTTNLSVVKPTKYFHVGGSIQYFGYSAFNQQRLSFSVAKKLSPIFSLGVQLNYVSTFIQDYGNTGNLALGLGLFVKPLSNLSLGFTVFNPTQAKYGRHTTDVIPSYAKLGMEYTLSEKVRFNMEADQQLNAKLKWRLGMYYQIHEVVHLAMGAATNPSYYTFGTALLFKKVRVDMAISIHQVIGLTPYVALSLPIAK
jgi:hypothetical protein